VPAEPREARPGLALDDVAFGYTPLDAPLIEGLCLHVPPGSRVALVGGTGSGKSTIGRLMIGLLPPRAGVVSLDGVALPAWDTVRLRPQIGYVDQTVGLFEGTVGDNVTLWDRSLPEARLVLAAQDAAVHDTILRRPGGYGAMLNENGRNFSGGERQRLAIARALAQSPRLLVLDEATSALDTLAEQEVMEAVRRRGCACVVIAHRLSAIRDSDEIIVLDRGAIVERGRHEALMARGGLYRMLVEH
jgi:ABC-type multidrug transport system fused ATPase/permease subunit